MNYILYTTYGLLGGFYYSGYYWNNAKYLWFIINFIVNVFSGIYCCFGYLITSKNIKTDDTLYTVLHLFGIFGITINIPGIIYYFRNELEIIISVIKHSFNVINSNVDIKKKLIELCIMYFVLFISFYFTYLLELMSFYDESLLQNNQYYIYPIPFVENVNSFSLYLLIMSIQILCATVCHACFIAVPNLFLFIGYSFYNGFIYLSEDLKVISKKISLIFKTSHIKENDRIIYNKQEIRHHQRKFLQHLNNIIRNHQIFIK